MEPIPSGPVPPQPEITPPPSSQIAPAALPPKRHGTAWLIILGVLVLVGASNYGVYYWQHQQVVSAQSVGQKATSSSKSATSAQQSSSQLPNNVAVSYPLSIPHKKVTSTLYLPAGYSVLQTMPVTGSQDALASLYTETFNDLMAHWEFTNKGTTQNPSDDLSSNDVITLSALGQWQQTNDGASVAYSPAQGPMTVKKKASFVANLKTTAASCAADTTKGFATNDHSYNVCYTLDHPQAVGADYAVTFSGYGELNGQPTYLRGFADLPNSASSYQGSLNSLISALKMFKTSIADNPNAK